MFFITPSANTSSLMAFNQHSSHACQQFFIITSTAQASSCSNSYTSSHHSLQAENKHQSLPWTHGADHKSHITDILIMQTSKHTIQHTTTSLANVGQGITYISRKNDNDIHKYIIQECALDGYWK